MMKHANINVELITEFAKDLTWEESPAALSDQLYILGCQNRRLTRLKGKVDWVVTDAPLLLGAHYTTPTYLPKTFKKLIYELWHSYNNYNFTIIRDKPYHKVGRSQNEDEAKLIDINIRSMLDEANIHTIDIIGDKLAAKTIFDFLFGGTDD